MVRMVIHFNETNTMNELLSKIGGILQDPRPSALCIVTSASGSVPGKTGAKMVVYHDGIIEGTVGGGGVEKRAIADALEAMREGIPRLVSYNLQQDLGMTCGGAVSVYIEPLQKPARLFIFGAGHIGKALARYAPDMGFETSLIDWRTDLFEGPETVRYTQVVRPYLEAIGEITFDRNCYLVIVTPNHEMDEEVLEAVGKQDVAYIGLIGSSRKIAALKKLFLDRGTLTQEELDRVDMPIGLPMNAITPAEIAISILAKLIDVKNSRTEG